LFGCDGEEGDTYIGSRFKVKRFKIQSFGVKIKIISKKMGTIKVGIIMGSNSDLPVMQAAADMLKLFDIPYEIDVVSAHRTPEKMFDYAKTAHERGLQVIIAGAGGAAHLPGMVASLTALPVIGVPIKSSNSIDGWDSLLSIVQMPNGVPVATVAVNAAQNAGILAAQIIGCSDNNLLSKIIDFKASLKNKVLQASDDMKK
jgi:5-(carboxyamino)imidazole ribonucleotide mutase